MDVLAARARGEQLVIFAGAGLSMPAPTCLPGWKAINEVVLDALAERLEAFTDKDFSDDIRAKLLASRDTTSSFSPDYQAQLIEDECGLDYFNVLQALDTDARNRGHDAIATLAAHGCLAAVVTTNFDRLIEQALHAAGLTPRVFFEPDDLAALPQALAEDGALPVIKVHGSVESPGSMVDTLRQRLAGRPEGLVRALADLLAGHHVVFAGFSGADLAHDPGYLGLRSAAAHNRGFTAVVRPGDDPVQLRALAAHWGAGARLVDGLLPDWFDGLLERLGIASGAAPVAPAAVDRTAAVAEHAARWASSLGHMLAVAIMAELLESSGRQELAFDLLGQTLRSASPDRSFDAPGYARFNYQLGRRLVERGTFDYAVDRQQGRKVARANAAGALQYSPFTANDCYQCLSRSAGELPQGYIAFGLYETYWGFPQDGAGHIREARQHGVEAHQPMVFIDACTALGIVYEILLQYADGLQWLQLGHAQAVRFGDEPRRARLCAELARLLATKARYEEAHERVQEGLTIAAGLDLAVTHLELLAAQGSVLIEQRRPEEALAILDESVRGLRAAGRRPALTRALIDCCYGRMRIADYDVMEAVTDELLDLTAVYPGYRPLILMMRARFAAWLGRDEEARTWVGEATLWGRQYQNPGVVEEVSLLAERLAG